MKKILLNTIAIFVVLTFYLQATTTFANAGLCTDEIIHKQLSAPVEKTLGNTRVTYAADSNFKALVTSSKRPLMVLIYNNDQDFSKGLAAVATCVLAEFPQFKFVAYDIRELSPKELDRAAFFTQGLVQTVPSLFIYRFVDNELELVGTIKEGYRETELVKKQIVRLSQFIWDKVLR